MKEKFILADGISGNELALSLAKCGINSFGVRVVSGLELAKVALIRSGLTTGKKTITNVEQHSIIYSFLNDIDYFKNASYVDARNLTQAFHIMRSCITEGDELDEITTRLEKGVFQKKNEAIIEAYTRYSNYLYQNNLVDADGILRFSLDNAKPFDAEFICISEAQITPAEKRLLEILSNSNYEEISIRDVYGLRKKELNSANAIQAYGAINEVEHIIEDIYKNHNLDECVVACVNEKTYSQLFLNLSHQYNIPISFGCGVSINNSNPAKLLKVLVN